MYQNTRTARRLFDRKSRHERHARARARAIDFRFARSRSRARWRALASRAIAVCNTTRKTELAPIIGDPPPLTHIERGGASLPRAAAAAAAAAATAARGSRFFTWRAPHGVDDSEGAEIGAASIGAASESLSGVGVSSRKWAKTKKLRVAAGGDARLRPADRRSIAFTLVCARALIVKRRKTRFGVCRPVTSADIRGAGLIAAVAPLAGSQRRERAAAVQRSSARRGQTSGTSG